MFLVLGVSVGYSSLSTSLNITGLITKVRLKSDIRITGLSLVQNSGEVETGIGYGQSNYQEYNKENISMGVYLPNNNSQVTYKVEMTNIGNVEMGLLNISNIPSNIEVLIDGNTYERTCEEEICTLQVKEKICNESNVCKLGIKKEYNVTIKYTSDGYDSSKTSYDLNLGFNFKPIYNVTYTDIEVLNTYPTYTLETDTLEVDLGSSAPDNIKVLMSDTEISEYTYSNGIVTIPNVSGNIEIQKAEEQETLAQYIANLYSPNSTVTNNSITYNVDTTNGIIDDGLGGTIASGGNLRYYGSNPNNYIDIGDRDASGNIILWRIIGVFETKYATDSLPCNIDSDSDGHYDNCATDKLVKIIKDDSIGDNIYWHRTSVNNWKTASLMKILNPGYESENLGSIYWNSGSGELEIKIEDAGSGIPGEEIGSTISTLDLTGAGLSSNIHNKVENVLWNLGGISSSSTDSSYYQNLYSEGYYKWERGTTVYSGNPTEWVGKIGLMYPSDYGYATNFAKCSQTLYKYNNSTSSFACRTNDWLFNVAMQWTITPTSSDSGYVFYVSSSGNVNYNNPSDTHGVRPVLYLKSDVSIVGEETTSDGINYYVVD